MRTRIERLWPLLALALIVAIVLLSFPYLASAYYLEAGGRAMDRPEEALEHLRKAIVWDPDNAQAFRLLALAYKSQGNRPAAQEAVVRYTEIRPRNPLGHIELAEMYEAMAAEAEAADMEDIEAKALQEWKMGGIMAHDAIAIGQSLVRAGQTEEAGTWYHRATRLAPDLADAWYYMGTLHGLKVEPQLALQAYERGLAATQFDRIGASDLWYRIGAVHQNNPKLGPLTEALRAYEEALALDDFRLIENSAWAHGRRGQVHYELNRDEVLAEQEMQQAIQLAPSEIWLYCIAGDFYKESGRLAEAKAMYERALRINAEFEAAKTRLDRLQ